MEPSHTLPNNPPNKHTHQPISKKPHMTPKSHTMALPRFGKRVNIIHKTVEPSKTPLDSDGFQKPTKYLDTPKTAASGSGSKPKPKYKKIFKVKDVKPIPKIYSSLHYIQSKGQTPKPE